MRFYQLEANKLKTDPQGDPCSAVEPEWFGTERDAVVARNEAFKAGKLSGLKRESLITPVDVPTDKAGLLNSLQDNVKELVVV